MFRDKASFNTRHPELQPMEWFYTNHPKDEVDLLLPELKARFSSVRVGIQAYDVKGNPFNSCVPIFVKD